MSCSFRLLAAYSPNRPERGTVVAMEIAPTLAEEIGRRIAGAEGF
jgi:hypothetical protein